MTTSIIFNKLSYMSKIMFALKIETNKNDLPFNQQKITECKTKKMLTELKKNLYVILIIIFCNQITHFLVSNLTNFKKKNHYITLIIIFSNRTTHFFVSKPQADVPLKAKTSKGHRNLKIKLTRETAA